MDALQKVIKKIHADPAHPTSSTLRALIKSLDEGVQFDLGQLYRLNYSDFGLALELMKEWRLDSFRLEPGWVTRAASETEHNIEFPQWMYAPAGQAAHN
jgi:hypothetical protein